MLKVENDEKTCPKMKTKNIRVRRPKKVYNGLKNLHRKRDMRDKTQQPSGS